MKYDPEIHHRRSIRLQGHDYSQTGAYFITLCTHNRRCMFGDIKDGEMVLNDVGKIVQKFWLEIPLHYPTVLLDEFVVMPNHVHGIIIIGVGVQDIEPQQVQNIEPQQNEYQKIIPGSIGAIVRGFKAGVTKWFRQNTDILTVWQRNYYEHIIRNEKEFYNIRNYIINNPLKWEFDEYYFQINDARNYQS